MINTPGTTASAREARGSLSLRVLEGLDTENLKSNSYTQDVIDGLRDLGASVDLWSWPNALFKRYDAIHVHWPEKFYRGRNRPISAVKRYLFHAVLLKVQFSKTRLVWTVHNLEPHGGSHAEEHLVDMHLRRSLTDIVLLNRSGLLPHSVDRDQVSVHEILHGDYRGFVSQFERREAIPGRLSLVGFLRPYKGIESLIASVQETKSDSLSLIVAGKPIDEPTERNFRHLANGKDGVHLRFGFLEPQEMVSIISSSMASVFPYEYVYNSGAIMLSLSLDRPVITRASSSTKSLQAEVGSHWVYLFDGDITPSKLQNLASKVSLDAHKRTQPDLSARDWSHASRKLHAVLLRGRTGAAVGRH